MAKDQGERMSRFWGKTSLAAALTAFGIFCGQALVCAQTSAQTAEQKPVEEAPSPLIAKVKPAEKGTLKNPYTDKPEAIEEGRKIYMGYSCNGCHGGGGGGGMCPPLTNEVWVYGSDDDTLFRLVTLGTVELQKTGYMRKGRESVVGPMPAFGELIKSEDELWKIIAFIRSVYKGDPARRNW
jgi:mono/diheme cytochrome c family protein